MTVVESVWFGVKAADQCVLVAEGMAKISPPSMFRSENQQRRTDCTAPARFPLAADGIAHSGL